MLRECLKTLDKTIFPNGIELEATYNEIHLSVCKEQTIIAHEGHAYFALHTTNLNVTAIRIVTT